MIREGSHFLTSFSFLSQTPGGVRLGTAAVHFHTHPIRETTSLERFGYICLDVVVSGAGGGDRPERETTTMTFQQGQSRNGKLNLAKAIVLLITGLTCYSSTLITLLIMDRAIGYSYGFPLTRQLLNEFETGGSQQQQQVRHSLDSSSFNGADGDEIRHSDAGLASQFRHFRHRHERKRMNRVKEALVSLLFLLLVEGLRLCDECLCLRTCTYALH